MRDSGLSGRLALVTGAGGGIGAAVVRLLVEEGARVVATDLPSTALSGPVSYTHLTLPTILLV